MKKIVLKKDFIWLTLIMVLGLFFRVWQLDSLPAILNRDEAALAYNAYTLLETGKDEWQRSWPLTLESFGDYKLPGYPWLLIPFLKTFGLHDWVVRLPSALAGTALIGLAYFFAKQAGLLSRKALFFSFLIATSPVFILYSRSAYEANVALTYFVGAMALIFSLRNKQKIWQYVLLAGLLLLAIFTYNTPFLLLPVLIIFTLILFGWQDKRKLFLPTGISFTALLIGLVILAPVASQKSGITIFTDETIWSQWIVFRNNLPALWQPLLGNKYLFYLWIAWQNTLSSFSYWFLVSKGGGHPWHSLPTMGHLFGAVYFFALGGIVATGASIWQVRKKIEPFRKQLALLFFLLASLIPAIITVDAPHATRSLLFFFLLHFFAVLGITALLGKVAKKFRNVVWQLIILTVIISTILHAQQLFVQYPGQQVVFMPGFDKIIQQAEESYPNEPVAIVDPAGYHYILLAWYLRFSPEQYFMTVIRQQPDTIGFRYGQQVGRYHFIADPADRVPTETILIQWSTATTTWQIEEYL